MLKPTTLTKAITLSLLLTLIFASSALGDAVIWIYEGPSNGGGTFGSAIDVIGPIHSRPWPDFDGTSGDIVCDFVVSNDHWRRGATVGDYRGIIYVINQDGDSIFAYEGLNSMDGDCPGPPDFQWRGEEFGTEVVSIGDANGDGYGDFIVSGPKYCQAQTLGGQPYRGKVYVFTGPDGDTLQHFRGGTTNATVNLGGAITGGIDYRTLDGNSDILINKGGNGTAYMEIILYDELDAIPPATPVPQITQHFALREMAAIGHFHEGHDYYWDDYALMGDISFGGGGILESVS